MSQTLKPLSAKAARHLATNLIANVQAAYARIEATDAADTSPWRWSTGKYIERMIEAEAALKNLIGAIAGRDAELDMGEVFDHGNDRPRADRYTHGRHLRECAEDAAKPAPRRTMPGTAATVQVQP